MTYSYIVSVILSSEDYYQKINLVSTDVETIAFNFHYELEKFYLFTKNTLYKHKEGFLEEDYRILFEERVKDFNFINSSFKDIIYDFCVLNYSVGGFFPRIDDCAIETTPKW